MIQKVNYTAKTPDFWSYTVIASTTLFGIQEFLQLLFKKIDRFEVDINELVDIIETIDEIRNW